MAKIKFVALGGLDERGKNLYLIEVNNSIFVFDVGLKFPEREMLGIDVIIPHSGEPRRRVRALPQTKRSAAVALGVSLCPLHDRRVHRPLVQIKTHARYFRSSKCRSKKK